jgi:CRP/FNR family transcriptional regulator, cyclic AMP receptor protein
MSLLEKNECLSSCEIDENLNFLRQTYFFSGLPLEALKVFAYLCNRELFKEGEFLFRQGEDDGRAFYLITGQAVLERKGNGGVQVIRQVNTGSFLGGISLLGSARRVFSLKAEKDSICLILTREKFSKTLEQFQEMTPKIFKALIQAINTWEEGFLSDRADQCGECMPNLGVSLL